MMNGYVVGWDILEAESGRGVQVQLIYEASVSEDSRAGKVE